MATKVNVISYGETKGMYMEVTDLKGQLFNLYDVTSVGPNVDTSLITDGWYMFHYCLKLTSWAANMPSLTAAIQMFHQCTKLTSFTGSLPNLTTGTHMFDTCTKLTSFSVDLPSLTNGVSMFQACSALASFTGDLSSLTNGEQMFYGCWPMRSFTVDLPSLTNAPYMFKNTHLATFSASLPSLTNARGMFEACKLNYNSLQNIVTTIKSWDSGSHAITIGVDSQLVTQAQQDEADTILTGKGWTVTWQRN